MHLLVLSLFVVTALFGLFLLSCHILNKPFPKRVAMIHGLVAITGLITLLLYTINHPTVLTSLIVFAGAGLGGIYMLFNHRSGKILPKFIPFIHGGVGMTGLTLLIYYLYR